MKYTENALNILALKTFKGIGRAWIVKHIKGNESVEEMVTLINQKSKESEEISVDDFESVKQQIAAKLEKIEESLDGVVAIGDNDFPQYRGNVKESDRPVYLFYKGNLDLLSLDNKNITVIGLLNPDEEIVEREKKIVAELVEREATIVSGLAFGCDSVAHIQALEGGKTVAILPSPIHNILPARNKGLAFQIVEEGGLLISEYYEDFSNSRELTTRYVERDRLQALFCDTIILIASYAQDSGERWNIQEKKLDSGARLAMGDAKKYGIPRYVMYNAQTDEQNPMFDLNRQLLEEGNTKRLTKKSIDKMIENITDKNNYQQTSLF
ncbi:DNA-processing protein DprA [Riemerella columbina]|uniref:DNA-processing protein DprA n=1 Tax=Riemerella columbina TaxID=103810 RepID=UPI00266EC524|nr:DNA-processing protein DprA [Riemerella columbina]WKS95820.1 DNA-protecting protein DprA [Riemerella columbina]